MIFDLAILETGSGGDLQLVGNDLAVVNGIENMPYLAMFGGSKESTVAGQAGVAQNAQSFDWWGNALLMPSTPDTQFNSRVEWILNSVPLTSAGRIQIQNTIIDDLQFMSPAAKIKVTVTITSDDRIDIEIVLSQSVGSQQVQIISFKKMASGDWVIFDFNNDFLI
jgi:hypothetical protein